jgi:hypothetical protein
MAELKIAIGGDVIFDAELPNGRLAARILG